MTLADERAYGSPGAIRRVHPQAKRNRPLLPTCERSGAHDGSVMAGNCCGEPLAASVLADLTDRAVLEPSAVQEAELRGFIARERSGRREVLLPTGLYRVSVSFGR